MYLLWDVSVLSYFSTTFKVTHREVPYARVKKIYGTWCPNWNRHLSVTCWLTNKLEGKRFEDNEHSSTEYPPVSHQHFLPYHVCRST